MHSSLKNEKNQKPKMNKAKEEKGFLDNTVHFSSTRNYYGMGVLEGHLCAITKCSVAQEVERQYFVVY